MAKILAPLHVGISVRNMGEAIAWYGQCLGFSLVKEDGYVPGLDAYICFLERDGFQIELFEYQAPIPLPEERRMPNTDLRTIGTKHIAFQVDDMEDMKRHLLSCGTEFAHETTMGGEHVLFIRDPSGVLIELIEKA